ncbi:MAG TPA: CaiB/BaiF CoA-transferase family protein [Syntrophales bacterium]|nr:CaiB/BaiF CoA-transferase family protein [Syntrophales bacterium]HOL59762.1 CaiB/BaiF CoA-transferase family protein [Syntrophales bacterium]HPO35928.1 CaiB/BaiF CoA-transferase family protein [Syntrophales bacterium]
MKKALEGIRICDLSHVLAAPTTSMLLADLGAEVIHIEPPRGDDAREFGPFIKDQSAYFISINRNKKSVVLDLKQEEGKQVLRDFVKVSDVVLENFRPGTMEKLGFGYEELKKINPRIIYASICGFGHDTLPEYGDKPAYDMVAQAYSGIMSITGPLGGPPCRVGTSVGDIVAGHQCAIAILAALLYRDKTGVGQKIDMSMVDGLVYILENAIVRYTVTGEVPSPLGSMHPTITPFQGYKTKDDWIIVPIGNDQLWAKFCEMIGRNDLVEHPKFKTNKLRTENRDELNNILDEIFLTKTCKEWLDLFEKYNLPCSPINTIDKVVNDPAVNYRKMIVEIDQPEVGKMKIAGSPMKMSETPGGVWSPAPLLGQHTVEVLKNVLNYAEDKIEDLRKKGTVLTYEDIKKKGGK